MKIEDLFKYSWFSDLAYVEWSKAPRIPHDPAKADPADLIKAANTAQRIPGKTSSGDTIIDTLGERIFQPADVGSGGLKGLGWKITAFHANAETDSGFAGSLFENPNTHEKVLALRGTEPGIDDLALADLRDIVKLGVAVEQAVAMVNWINRLRAPRNADVTLVSLPSDYALAALSALPTSLAAPGLLVLIGGLRRYTLPGAGLGLLKSGDALTVTGHSLGGHLANIAIRLFPTLFRQSVTFNAPGFDTAMGVGMSETFFSALRAVGLAPDAARSFSGLSLYNLQGDGSAPGDDLDVIADLGTLPGDQQHALIHALIEVSTHSMEELVTTLGVHSLLATLLGDGTSFARTNSLIAAASPHEANTDERLVDLLTDLLIPGKAYEPLPVSAGSYFINAPDFDTRTPLHARLLELQSSVNDHPGTRLRSLADMTAMDLTDLARQSGAQGLPYRYALQQGIPFAITGKDDAATAALYAPHNTDHRLDRYRPDTRTGHLSDTQLRDRAVLLATAIEANSIDQLPLPNGWTTSTQPLMAKAVFENLANGYRFAGRGAPIAGSARPVTARQIVFGTDAAETLTGGKRDDRLYGMAGDDVLEGKGGDDYLEGGPGNDQYVSNSDQGRDWIFDSDGEGRIVVDGDRLIGGEPIGDNLWQSMDGRHRFALTGEGDLHIDGRIRVERFHDGDLGIELAPTATPETPTGTVLKDPHPNKVLSTSLASGDPDASYQAYGDTGNDWILTARADDLLNGGAGDDWMISGMGDDQLRGGDGNDALFPGEGTDTATGGAGDDLIVDAHYRVFDSSGSENTDADAWHALVGHFTISLLADPYLDDAGEVTQAYTLFLPSGSFAGELDAVSYRYDPIDPTHGRIAFDPDFEVFVSHALWGSPDTAPNSLSGGAGNDYLAGNEGPDLLAGDEGNDSLLGGKGDDDLIGGTGDDLLLGQQDRDLLDGGAGADRLFGGSGEDILYGGSGDDLLVGDNDQEDRGAADRLFGDAGNDLLHGNGGDDWLEGGADHDVLWGHDGDDALLGGDGNDELHGDGGDDLLYGGSGTDLLDGGAGDDRLAGGEGADLYLFAPGSGQDWIEESGTDTDRIHFAPGIALGSLRYGREDDDLQIDLPGGNGLRLARFFSRNLSYLLHDGNGRERLINPTLIETKLAPDHPLSLLELDALYSRAIEENTASLLGLLGFAREDAEHWARDQTDRWGRVTTHRTTFTTLTAKQPDGDYLRTLPAEIQTSPGGATPDGGQEIETRIQRLDLTLGDGADRFEIEDKYHHSLNRVDGGAGDDVLDASVGRDYPGRSPIHLSLSPLARLPADLLPGSLLYGNTGDDRLIGSDGGDYLIGGPGNDQMRGGMGGDLYVTDGGHDLVFEDGGVDRGSDRLLLPDEAIPEAIRYRWHEIQASNIHVSEHHWSNRMISAHRALTLDWGTDDSVTLILPHTDQHAGYGIDQVTFGNGRTVSMETLLAGAAYSGDADPQRGANRLHGNRFLHGYAGDDHLQADTPDQPIQIGWFGRYDAVLIGGAGRDTLEGNLGHDLLIGGELVADYSLDLLQPSGTLKDPGNHFDGGPGNDTVWATAGSDLILFGVGDGHDWVRDLVHNHGTTPFMGRGRSSKPSAYPAGFEDSEDILRFKPGISPDDIQVRRGRGTDPTLSALTFEHRNGADSITFEHWFDAGRNQLSRVDFADGYFWDRDDIEDLLRGDPADLAPSLAAVPPALPALIPGSELTIGLPELFADPEGSTLDHHLSTRTGDALPDWLHFDPASRTLSGTAPADLAGPIELTLTVRDEKGKPASLALTLEVDRDRDATTAAPPVAIAPADEVTPASTDATAPAATPSLDSSTPELPVMRREGAGIDRGREIAVASIAAVDRTAPTTKGPAPLDLDRLNTSDDALDIATAWPFDPASSRVAALRGMPAAAVSVPTSERWARVRTALKSLDAADQGRSLGERLGASGYRVEFSSALHGPSLGAAPRGSVIGLRSGAMAPFSGLHEGFQPGYL